MAIIATSQEYNFTFRSMFLLIEAVKIYQQTKKKDIIRMMPTSLTVFQGS